MASDQSIADHDPLPRTPIQEPSALPSNSLLPLTLRLDRTNYSYWRALVMAAVRAYNIEGYLLGTIPAPPAMLPGNIPNPAHFNWHRFDQFIVHWLMNSVTEPMLGHIVRCRTSAEIWTVLATLFATKSKARILQVKGLLQSTKKGSLFVEEYILKMKLYADTLMEAGEPITEDCLCLYILGGLGSEYEAVVVNLTNRSDSISLQDLQYSLQTQEMRLQSLASSNLDQIQANMANLSIQNNSRGNGRGSRGSMQRGGRNRGQGRSNGRGNRVVCQLCGKMGHTV